MSAGVSLSRAEIRRGRLKFGLLTVAVSLLIFLVLLLTTLSNALVSSLVGAISGLKADGLVYAQSARDNLAASRLDPATAEIVAGVPGVAAVGSVGTLATTGIVSGTETDLQVFGFEPGRPGAPTGLVAGRLPEGPGEMAIDGGGAVGDAVDVQGQTFTIVGELKGAQFNALTTGYIDRDSFDAIVTAINPGLPFVPVNAVAFDVEDGQDVALVSDAITNEQIKGYPLSLAVELIPGIESIGQSFGILVGLTFVIGIVVIGFFFLILTVQKLRVFTLLRAIGATSASLSRQVLQQVTVVVLLASIVALVLTSLALNLISTGIPVSLEPVTILTTVLGVWVFSLAAGLLSVRRITRLDPSTAVGAR